LARIGVPRKDLCSYLLGKGLVRRVWMRLHIRDGDPSALAPFCVFGFPDGTGDGLEHCRAVSGIEGVQRLLKRWVLEYCLLHVFFWRHPLPLCDVLALGLILSCRTSLLLDQFGYTWLPQKHQQGIRCFRREPYYRATIGLPANHQLPGGQEGNAGFGHPSSEDRHTAPVRAEGGSYITHVTQGFD